MEKAIVIVEADAKEAQELAAALEAMNYRTISFLSPTDLESILAKTEWHVLIVGLDNSAVDNRFLRVLKRSNPELRIVALSNRPFHPELKEAMSSHIYACVKKPVDFDELIFWLESIFEGIACSGKEADADVDPYMSENSLIER